MARYTVLVIITGCLLTACSPYVYKDEITNFSSGVTALNSSYQTGHEASDANALQQQQAGYAASRLRLRLLSGCLDSALIDPSTPCLIVPANATAPPPPTLRQKAIADAAPDFAALKSYADALAAVTNAADDTTLTQATQSLSTAVDSLQGATARLAPSTAAAGTIVTQATSFLGLAITTYLDFRRYAALRDKVPGADNAIQTISKTVRAALQAIKQVQLAALVDDLLVSQAPFLKPSIGGLSQAQYQTQLAAFQAKVTAFNQARAADPAAAVDAMVTAHKQLADALKNGSGQLQAVEKYYREHFATENGLPVTWKVLYSVNRK